MYLYRPSPAALKKKKKKGAHVTSLIRVIARSQLVPLDSSHTVQVQMYC